MKVTFAFGLFTFFVCTMGSPSSYIGKFPQSTLTTHDNYILNQDVLRTIMQSMIKDLTYSGEGLFNGGRHDDSNEELEHVFSVDYDDLHSNSMDEINGLRTNLRDQEFLHHSSLWGEQYLNENSVGKQRIKPPGNNHKEIKTDGTLPAYCNPPNPCPYTKTSKMGCLDQFENTASFSRRYQAAQDCMCDTEHMFECSTTVMDEDKHHNVDDITDELNEIAFDEFIQRTIQGAFKNPFLAGEKLPTAAKKGTGVAISI